MHPLLWSREAWAVDQDATTIRDSGVTTLPSRRRLRINEMRLSSPGSGIRRERMGGFR
jgi:hypothetical protein